LDFKKLASPKTKIWGYVPENQRLKLPSIAVVNLKTKALISKLGSGGLVIFFFEVILVIS
jgi:hypothetical protein